MSATETAPYVESAQQQDLAGPRKLEVQDAVEHLFGELHDLVDLVVMIGVVRDCLDRNPSASLPELETAVHTRLIDHALGASPPS